MKLNVVSLGLAFGILWGGAILLVGVAGMISPGYGQAFLQVIASVYPGYSGAPTLGQSIIGALYGLVDGGIGGMVFAWLYNWLSTRFAPAA